MAGWVGNNVSWEIFEKLIGYFRDMGKMLLSVRACRYMRRTWRVGYIRGKFVEIIFSNTNGIMGFLRGSYK